MLFDSDVLVWFLRGNEKAARFLEDESSRMTSVISWMELVQGVRDKRELAVIKAALPRAGIKILPLTEAIGSRAAEYMEQYSLKNGMMLADALVGATAAEYDLPLATANVKHFRHLIGVKVHVFKVY